jgi:hypothetical protein
MKKITLLIAILAVLSANVAISQWNSNGNNIFNTNTGNVGIGNNAPATLLHVQKSMIEPMITVQNLGGSGGATYTMIDNASGANWKFKATLSGGFKIRDHANSLDVIVIEPNSFTNALYIKSTDNVGIGTATPDNSALVDMNSTTKGMLVPRLNQSQMVAISNPADGLIVYCTTDGKMYIYVLLLNIWKEIAYGSVNYSPFTCGSPITVNHMAGAVAPVNKTVTYGTVANIPGEASKCWITSNLGADHQASAKDDATEASAGWYWQFNRMQGFKHDGITVTPEMTITENFSENSDWIAANDPCTIELGSGWRIPTSTEWSNVDQAGNWNNWNDTWASPLKAHAAGHVAASDEGGVLQGRGAYGHFFCSTQYNLTFGRIIRFHSSYSYMDYYGKSGAFSIRCIKG